MIQIRVNGELLDLELGASLTFTSRAGFFAEPGSVAFPGSWSFPFKVPHTGKNLRLLDFPSRLDASSPLFSSGRAEVYHNGVFLFLADLYLKKGGRKISEGFLVVGELAKLQDAPLSSEDYGPDIVLGADQSAALATAKDTAVNPSNYNYVFFPIKNNHFFPDGEGPDPWDYPYQNYYDSGVQAFQAGAAYRVATPFLKLHFILRRIFEGRGFSYVDEVFTTEELKNIVIYNNHNIYDSSTDWALSFRPGDHLPDIKTIDFVKEIFRALAIAPIFDLVNNKITIRRLSDIAEALPVLDWTAYAQDDWTSEAVEGAVEALELSIDEADAVSGAEAYGRIDFDVTADVEKGTDIVSPQPGERYFIWSTDRIIQRASNRWFIWANGKRKIDIVPGSDKVVKFGIQEIRNHDLRFPEVGYLGSDTLADFFNPVNLIRWTIFRGMRTIDGQLRPYASHVNYDDTAAKIGDYSLGLAGPYGIYEQFWKSWARVVSSGVSVSQRFYLPVNEWLKFDHTKKVRVGNQNYFVKEIKTAFSSGKYLVADAIIYKSI